MQIWAVVDGDVNVAPERHLDASGSTATTGEQVNDQFGLDVEQELIADHAASLAIAAREWIAR
jgi:hypothetical protein